MEEFGRRQALAKLWLREGPERRAGGPDGAALTVEEEAGCLPWWKQRAEGIPPVGAAGLCRQGVFLHLLSMPAMQGGTYQMPALTHFWLNLPPKNESKGLSLQKRVPRGSAHLFQGNHKPSWEDTRGCHSVYFTWELHTNYCPSLK